MIEPRRRRLLRLPFQKNAAREEAHDEIRFHLDMKTQKLREMGFTEAEARAEAERRFGDVERVGDEVEQLMMRRERAMRSSDHLERIRRDSAYAVRQIFRNPVFSSVAVLTIAIAIGATTSVYSVVDTILLRPLPYSQPDELVMIWADYTRRGGPLREWLSYPNYIDFRDEVPAMDASSLFYGWNPTLSGAGEAEQLNGAVFTYGMFSEVLDVAPALGRGFTPEDDVPSTRVALISDAFWRQAFGADESIVGRDIILNDVPQTVIGVMPADFRPPGFLGTDVWTPLGMDVSTDPPRGDASFRSVGRMSNEAYLDLVRTQSDELGLRLEQEYPNANTGVGYRVVPLKSDLLRGASTPLWVLLGAVGLVLLVACVNVANLLLARGTMREAELAVRSAMGAGRGGILAQVMTESVILALVGGVLGTALAFGGTQLLVSLAPSFTPRLGEVSVDGRILGFAAGVTALAGLLFGMLPAVRASRTDPAVVLRDGGRSGPGLRTGRLRSALVVSQIGLTLVLLVGAGLLVRSFQNLQAVDLGFDPDELLTMQVFMPPTRYPDAPARRAFMANLEARLAGIPGVEGVGSVNSLPLASFDGDVRFNVEGEPLPEPGEQIVWIRRATVGYFDAMDLQLVAGRGFAAGDTDDATQIVIVNETMATRAFGSPDAAVGKRINVNSQENTTWRPIVGVVRDVKNFGLRNGSRNAMYVPFNQLSSAFMFTVLRTGGDPLTAAASVRREVGQIDPTIAVASLRPMESYVSTSLATDRFSTALVSGFALVALLLAVVGLYGVVSYSVSTRLREMGVRIALGAGGGSIRGLILRRSLGQALIGIALGAVGAAGVTRLMSSLLFEVGAGDPLTFAATAALMAASALLASLVPAWRATRVDPVRILKAE